MVGLADPVVWHDVECGAYEADLPLWRELAGAARGPILDLGCGTGRVALDLAERGFEVIGLDPDAALVAALRERARALPVEGVVADARSFRLDRSFPLAIAPMQVVQLLGGADGRVAALAAIRAHLTPRGVFAAALADPFEGVGPEQTGPPLPDVREQDGWVFSSLPTAVREADGATIIDRLRQVVSPGGELQESMTSIVLDTLDADDLEREGAAAGFAVRPRRSVPPTADYVGSAIVLLEAP